jgi:uncharacterized protein (TIGR02001 family)
MKKLVSASLVLFGVVAPSVCSAESLAITGTVAFESRYVFRGVELSEQSFQPSIALAKNGFTATGWFNFPIDNENPASRRGEEIDIVLDYSTSVAEAVTLGVGFTYYTYQERDRGFFDTFAEDGDGLGANSFEPYVSLAFAVPLSPKVTLFHDFNFDTTTLQGAVAHSIPLADKFSADLSGFIGYVFDDTGGVDFLYGQASANLSYKFTDKVSGYAGARFGGSDIAGGGILDDAALGTRRASAPWFGLGLTASF